MSDMEKLRDALWSCVILVCLLFFAFAAGVACMEREEAEPEADSSVEAVETAAVMLVPAAEEPQERQLGLCEDTYLREDIPLDYATQMLLYGACLEFDVDFNLMLALIEQETRFQNIKGDGGDSEGFCQIQDRWWSGLMAEIGAENLMDPEDNFRTGCAIMRQLMDKYVAVEDALSAYNRGKPGQTKYSREVLDKMEAIKGE